MFRMGLIDMTSEWEKMRRKEHEQFLAHMGDSPRKPSRMPGFFTSIKLFFTLWVVAFIVGGMGHIIEGGKTDIQPNSNESFELYRPAD